jgi:hypothetical protein
LTFKAAKNRTSVSPWKRGDSDANFKRLSQGRFRWWPNAAEGDLRRIAAHQVAVLFSAGDPNGASAAPDWRPIGPRT